MYTLEDVRKEYDRLDALLGIDTKDVELKKVKDLELLDYSKSRGTRKQMT